MKKFYIWIIYKGMISILTKLPMKLVSYAKKHPYRMLISGGLLYFCYERIMGFFKDIMNGSALEPSGKEEDIETKQEPEMDDVSMYSTSKDHTETIANMDAQLEDLINATHQ